MTIWILAVILMASLAGIGYRQGVIRVAFSLLGILLGALLATTLARFVRLGMSAVGIKDPTVLWLLAPVIVFAVILTAFKIGGLAVHKKVEVYYKYKAGDLRLALWERLMHRLGLCLGFANGIAYLILISFVIYIFSYWTVQLASSGSSDSRGVRILNRLGEDLQSTGMDKVACAIDQMPAIYYETADLAGMLYHTPLLEARLSRYPAFLGLGEQPEFQDLGNDVQFAQLWQSQKPVKELLDYPKVKAMLKDRSLMATIWTTLQSNLGDLRTFLRTGESPKYDSEKILGRWDFDINGAISLLRISRPHIVSSEMARYKSWLEANFSKTSFVATTDRQVYLKNIPEVKPGPPPTVAMQTAQGQWKKGSDGKYEVDLTLNGKQQELTTEIQVDRLTLAGGDLPLAFVREN